jgi:voltage-gated potassium channel
MDSRRRRILVELDKLTDRPMIWLSFIWLVLVIIEFVWGLSRPLETLVFIIWMFFIVDFAIALSIAPNKKLYLKQNIITLVAILLPALRALRIFRAAKGVQAARGVRSVTLLRVLTTLNRGIASLKASFARHGVGYLVLISLIIMLGGAAGMNQFEAESFNNFGDALWWTAMLMTTIGSEFWPKTVEGRILCWVLSLYALGVFGYITATLASHFIGVDQRTARMPSSQP